MTDRRSFLLRTACAMAAATRLGVPAWAAAATGPQAASLSALAAAFAQLEREAGGRLGVCVWNMSSGERAGHRLDERFPMCSTFKMLLAAAVLQRVDAGRERLDRALPIPPRPLVSNSPLTDEHAGGSMPVAALCHAILTRSDNTAANVLLDTVGGPNGITRFARSMGDTVTRLDRTETSLNESAPGDPRDTTSPAAMAADMERLLVGNALSAASRAQLVQWMTENRTGSERLRAAAPADWHAADKTGSNLSTTTNDIAIFWPPERKPLIVTAYLTECPGEEAKRGRVLAEIGRMVVEAVQRPG